MFDNSQSLRHLPYFTELASLDDGDPSWRAVSAGLVVLRLIDAWIEDGPAVVAADGWGMRSVEAAIEEMPDGLPERAILMSAMLALSTARAGDLHAVAPRLMAYARALDLDAKWSLAADVYETVIAHVHPDEESEIAVNALLRRGHCLRELGDFEEATSTFATAGQLAHKRGDIIGALRARIGEAKIIMERGNLSAADAMFAETQQEATAASLYDLRSLATHDRAHIAHMGGKYDLAIRFAYDAMRDSSSETERDRILNDLAGSFYMLGVKSAARDAFVILAATARGQYQRWAATINLMEMSAEDSVEVQFERYRQQLEIASLPPLLQTQFEMHAGRGYRLLGDSETSRRWLDRALCSATEHRFNQLVFAIEDELRTPAVSTSPTISCDIPRDIEMIAEDLRNLRRMAGVS